MTSQCTGDPEGRTWVPSFPHGWGLTLGGQLLKLRPQLPGWTKLLQPPNTWLAITDMMSTKESSCTAAIYLNQFTLHLFLNTVS